MRYLPLVKMAIEKIRVLMGLAQWMESACGLKGPRFDSGQGHVPWLWAHPQCGGGVQEAAD